jgi:hypothetical protein
MNRDVRKSLVSWAYRFSTSFQSIGNLDIGASLILDGINYAQCLLLSNLFHLEFVIIMVKIYTKTRKSAHMRPQTPATQNESL